VQAAVGRIRHFEGMGKRAPRGRPSTFSLSGRPVFGPGAGERRTYGGAHRSKEEESFG
jgi:hypothetical protein